jgi:hypothetical protein
MKPHPAYTADDMPTRKLQAYVRKGLQSGAGIEPLAIAKALFEVASRDKKVPLHLPLGSTAVMLIKSKLEGRLADLEAVKELSAVDQ